MFFANKIILVDDNIEDLNTLSQALHKSGLPCIPFQYDGLDFPQAPLEEIRIAFFDIYLQPGQTSPDYNKLADALTKYVSNKSAPFVLIFWSKHTEEKDNFLSYIRDRKTEYPDIPEPYFVVCIDKSEASRGNLHSKIEEVISMPILKALFGFQDAVQEASSKTIKEIFSIIPKNNNYADNSVFEINFNRLFSRIAQSTYGLHHAKENPEQAVFSALLPMLGYFTLNNINNQDWKTILTILKNASKVDELNYSGFPASKLNTIFHIDESNSFPYETRGGVFKSAIRNEEYQDKIGLSYDTIIESFLKNKTNSSHKTDLITNSEIVWIEFSASCDYTQKKTRLNKYALALKKELTIKRERFTENVISDLPSFHINNKECNLYVNLNIVIGCLSNQNILGSSLFIIKNEMLEKIGSRYANHVSRIGTVDF